MLPIEFSPIELLLGAVLGLLATCVVLLAVVVRRAGRAANVASQIDALAAAQERAERGVRDEVALSRREIGDGTRHLRLDVTGAVQAMSEGVEKRLDDVRGVMDARLAEIHQENARQLEAVRVTVDEKLQGTLEERLGKAFAQVSERLEAVHQGLGEMQNLATSVGSLEKVLANVKTRGSWGEFQLGALLEQTLAPQQYDRNVAVKRGSAERVEFAIRLPGPEEGGEPVWLPIDAKFPHEDHARLQEAREQGDVAAAHTSGRALEVTVLREARRIRDKYVSPPRTTDFAILFLPTEALYADVLGRPGLVERIQRECRVTVAGPATLSALLTSLQMGFRTLAIQKRSGEVWKLLGAVKGQFRSFSELLDKVSRKLEEASNTVGEASRKTQTIERRLGQVEQLPDGAAREMLRLPDDASEEDRGPGTP
jgi:DNA recombination protein RmuC